jgi:outer membrane protein assembly factor BamB
MRFGLMMYLGVAAMAVPAWADWTNLGGNPGRNCVSTVIGPSGPEVRWSEGPASIIAWHPSIEGERVFVVRQSAFVPNGVPNEAPVIALDLVTGDELWSTDIPFESGDWTTVVFGVSQGRVYAGRSGNGSSSAAPLYCLDAATGEVLWTSDEEIHTGAYDGVAFAPDGDPVVVSHQYVRRIESETGETAWNTVRSCSVSGDCGPAIANGAVYIDEVAPGGQIVTKIDLETGMRLYSSTVMPGFLSQTTPIVAPDGTVYYPRIQSNPAVDFVYAWADVGSGFELKWSLAATGRGIATDAAGSLYMLGAGKTVVRVNKETGRVTAQSPPLIGPASMYLRFAIGGDGTVYVSNGEFAQGRLYAFTADLDHLWDVGVTNINQAGPSLASDGTLVVCSITDVRAYFTGAACESGDLNCDGVVDGADLGLLLAAWGSADEPADLNGDGTTDGADLGILLSLWTG